MSSKKRLDFIQYHIILCPEVTMPYKQLVLSLDEKTYNIIQKAATAAGMSKVTWLKVLALREVASRNPFTLPPGATSIQIPSSNGKTIKIAIPKAGRPFKKSTRRRKDENP
jgi:hypothetical protein